MFTLQYFPLMNMPPFHPLRLTNAQLTKQVDRIIKRWDHTLSPGPNRRKTVQRKTWAIESLIKAARRLLANDDDSEQKNLLKDTALRLIANQNEPQGWLFPA